MKLPSLKRVLLAPLALFIIFYIVGAIVLLLRTEPELAPIPFSSKSLEVAIFGASGTAGDGILKAALASKDIQKIHVITRRLTPRIQVGIESGKVNATLHQNYLDYSAIIATLKDVDAVFWAIGISSLGVDEETYSRIHVDFPVQFVNEWVQFSTKVNPLFHFISSSDISENSNSMWVRQKIRAEKSLFKFAQNSKLQVIAYRPDYIGPTVEEAHLGQKALYWFFRPVGAAVQALEIGRAMIDLSLRNLDSEVQNGTKISTGKIKLYSKSYEERQP